MSEKTQVNPAIELREMQIQYEMLRQRTNALAQWLHEAVERVKELEAATDGATE